MKRKQVVGGKRGGILIKMQNFGIFLDEVLLANPWILL
jgi:hypothetical protein